MLLLARLLLGAACALAAPAAHARSWVMTPDPADTPPPYDVSLSAVELPPEAIGLVNEEESLSVHFQYLSPACSDCEVGVHFDQPPSGVWVHFDPPCAAGAFYWFLETGQTVEFDGQPTYLDSVFISERSNCNGTGSMSGTFTYEFSVFPSQVDFYMWFHSADPEFQPSILSTVSATVEVAALAPTLESLGMALLAAGFVLGTLVAARPTSWPS